MTDKETPNPPSSPKPYEVRVPSKRSMMFNENVIPEGTPVYHKAEINDHWFLGLIQEFGPYFTVITNGHISQTIEVKMVLEGTYEIVPINPDPLGDLVVECIVFDTGGIPIGSTYIDQDGLAFMVNDVQELYMEVFDHKGQLFTIYADVFFGLDNEEQGLCKLIYPPLVVQKMVDEYKGDTT